MKEELPMFGIEANDLLRQHIDREGRRELENMVAAKLRDAAAATGSHAVGTRAFILLGPGVDHHRRQYSRAPTGDYSGLSAPAVPQIRQRGAGLARPVPLT